RASDDLAGAAADSDAQAECARRLGRLDAELDARFYLASAVSWSDRERCLAAADEAITRVSRLADPFLQAHTRGRSAYGYFPGRDWTAEHVAAIAAAEDAARQAGDSTILAQHAGRHSYFLALASRYDEADRLAGEAAELALAAGDASEYLLCHFYR